MANSFFRVWTKSSAQQHEVVNKHSYSNLFSSVLNVIVTKICVCPLLDEMSNGWYQSDVCICINETVFTNESIAVDTVFSVEWKRHFRIQILFYFGKNLFFSWKQSVICWLKFLFTVFYPNHLRESHFFRQFFCKFFDYFSTKSKSYVTLKVYCLFVYSRKYI